MKKIFSIIAAVLGLVFAGMSYAQGNIKADNVIDITESKVSYDIKTAEGEDLVVTADYASGSASPEIENMDIFPRNSINEGIKAFTVTTKEGVPIEIQYAYSGGERVGVKISTKPSHPSSDSEYAQVLSVESKGGYIIKFMFVWQGKDLKEVRVEPLVNPFAA
ncbi:MAG: hypothetical protein NTY76_06525 [Candidatus Omnitrophica bacterium]|nr:hypothetical protein [Candidatus Omnitrophota bacterium]